MMILTRPSLHYKESLLEYKNTFIERKESIAGGSFLRDFDTVEEWLDFIQQLEHIETTPKHLVSALAFILVDTTSEKVIGMCDLRLSLAIPYLKEFGGHVGYSIHPDYRKNGYGKLQLHLLLKEAKKVGFEKVLVTCDEENRASAKIIESNNGVLEKVVFDEEGNGYKRYWINL
ncbi:GNAT family N-acetyltransferase [Carnobacteriaceae bacterium zg-C25]|nr:GNAT family N-acetyltransferase [Carnobacteriaceae bacterium zg-C25]